jgi:aspartyl aminopeptidase
MKKTWVLAVLVGLAWPAIATAEPGEAYKAFLAKGLTAERAVREARRRAAAEGYREIDLGAENACAGPLAPGDKLVFVWHDRSALFVRVGQRPLSDGIRLIGAHVDAPALRLLPEPFVARPEGAASLQAQAYGGLRAYQYRHRALRLVGRVARADGVVDFDLGPEQGFVFVMDALDSLEAPADRGREDSRQEKPAFLVAASVPLLGKSSPREALATLIHKHTGVRPADFLAAEIYAVSAAAPRDVGLDRSLIGAAGQDDRFCSFAALEGLMTAALPLRTAAVLLVDREEIGSTGPTGARAPLLPQAMACLARAEGTGALQVDTAVRRALAASQALSADVKPALDPGWPEVFAAENTALLGLGPTIAKYTGYAGKLGGSDAHPELSQVVRQVAARAGVSVQSVEIGKVDAGGGGTIAKFLAALGVDVIDVGLPLLSMHAPLEITAKRDLVAGIRLYRAWLEEGP